MNEVNKCSQKAKWLPTITSIQTNEISKMHVTSPSILFKEPVKVSFNASSLVKSFAHGPLSLHVKREGAVSETLG